MKTIFISIYDGDAEKNVLRSGVLSALKASGHRIIILIRGEERKPYYKKEFSDNQVTIDVLPVANSFKEKIWYHISRNSIPTRAVYVRNVREYYRHKNFLRFLCERILSHLAHLRIYRELLRALYAQTGERYADDLFERYQPDLVFAQNMFSPEDCRLLLSAKRRNITTVTTVKSWDVLPTKAFTRVRADRVLVFNEFNKQEALSYGDYNESQIVVTGFPQFDIYQRTEHIQPREQFLRSLGMSTNDKYVFYSIPGDWKLPYTRDVVETLDIYADEKKFVNQIRVYVEIHPKYSDPTEQAKLKHVLLRRPGTYFSQQGEFSLDSGGAGARQWTFTQDDIEHLANVLHHAEAVICTDSTLSLDATASDRPVILIAYDGHRTLPYKHSIAFIYEREHYRNVIQTRGVQVVRSHTELLSAINTVLQNPEYLRSEREELKRKLLYLNDGKASERVAKAILELVR